MKEKVYIAIVFLTFLVVVGCAGSKEETTTQAGTIDNDSLQAFQTYSDQQNILLRVSVYANQSLACGPENVDCADDIYQRWDYVLDRVMRTHDPLVLEYPERVGLYSVCNQLLTDVVSVNYPGITLTSDQKLVLQYLNLQCMHGYALYEDALLENIENPLYVDFITENMTSYTELFPLNVEVPDFDLGQVAISFQKPNYCGDGVCDWDEDSRWCSDCSRGILLTIPISREYYKCVKAVGEYNLELWETYGADYPSGIYSKSSRTECGNYLSDANSASQVRQIISETIDTPLVIISEENNQIAIDSPVTELKSYDFPFLEMDKGDAVMFVNGHSISKELLSDYHGIGVTISEKSYTVIVENGLVTEIKDGLSDSVDFQVTTTEERAYQLITKARSGQTAAAISDAIALLPAAQSAKAAAKFTEYTLKKAVSP